MWHTDQPGTHSAKITQSVLTLTGMVSVELDRILPSIPTLPLSLHLLPFSSLPLLLLLLPSPSLSFLLPLLFSSFPSFPPFLPPSLPLLSQIFYSFSFLPSTPYVTFLSYSPSIPPSSFSSAPHLLPPHPFLPSSTFCLPSPYLSLSCPPSVPLRLPLSLFPYLHFSLLLSLGCTQCAGFGLKGSKEHPEEGELLHHYHDNCQNTRCREGLRGTRTCPSREEGINSQTLQLSGGSFGDFAHNSLSFVYIRLYFIYICGSPG